VSPPCFEQIEMDKLGPRAALNFPEARCLTRAVHWSEVRCTLSERERQECIDTEIVPAKGKVATGRVASEVELEPV
jgi:hypothetical protein